MKQTAFPRMVGFFVLVIFFSQTVGGPLGRGSAVHAQAAAPTAPSSPFYTGDGGRGTRLAVLIPAATGLSAEQSYLPSLVQGVLAGDLSKYSAIDVVDRQRLETVLKETESGIYKNDTDYGRIGEIANVDYTLTGTITRTGAGFAVQIQVVGTGQGSIGVTKAAHNGSFTIAELDDFTGIRRVSMDLLSQMGVNLTNTAKQELSAASAVSQVNAQTALARGITAQRQGTEVAALSYYFQAATYDPSLMEAANRSSILNANITSGNIGDNVRTDIQWRRDWVARLTETEQFFNNFNQTESMPYTLFYTTEIKQGAINYQNETVNMSIETHLHGSGIWTVAIKRALQAVYDGLDATKRKNDWELAGWPQRGVTNLNAFAARNQNFSVVFELLNEQNKAIGRQTLQTGGSWGLNWSGRPTITVNADDRKTLNFQNVNANDITDKMTIRVATVNGTNAETAARSGVLQIRASSKSEFETNDQFRYSRGEIQGFAGNRAANLTIPDNIWGDSVTSIREEAFRNTGLTSLRILNSITSIPANTFSNNQLTRVTIPDSVTSIGANAFRNNKLAVVTIPDNVTSIGDKAFSNNPLILTAEFAQYLISRGFSDGFSSDESLFTVNSNGDLTHYRGDQKIIIIPSTVNGRTVTAITGHEMYYSDGKPYMGGAFEGESITFVVIPDSVTTIGNRAFSNSQLTGVIIGNRVDFIGNNAFYQNQLTSVTIPDSIRTIGTSAFSRNPMTSVTMGGNSVTSIAAHAFNLTRLTSITIGAGVRLARECFGENGFANAYDNTFGKMAGTYTRPNNGSTTWTMVRQGTSLEIDQEKIAKAQEEVNRQQAVAAKEAGREAGKATLGFLALGGIVGLIVGAVWLLGKLFNPSMYSRQHEIR